MIWKLAVDDLKQVAASLDKNSEDLVVQQQNLAVRMAKLKDDLKYTDREDKYSLLQELDDLVQREEDLQDKIVISRDNTGTPYFARVVSDEGFYISKHFTDLDNGIIKYTAPVATLRYKDVGETAMVNGFRHQVREKQQLVIQDKNLLELNHHDEDGYYVCDSEKFRQLLADEQDKDIEVHKKHMEATPQPRPEEQKKYVLGEIIAKMREEQDTVMRAPIQGVTLIKGAAGSGKTNIAFHRIVYLCSEHPNHFRQDNVAVFCFNVALKQYLFNMLAELNIPRVKVFSMDDWFYSTLREITNIGWLEYKEDPAVKHIKTRLEIINILNEFHVKYQRQLQQALNQVEHEDDSQIQIDAYSILNLLYTHQPFLDYIKSTEDYSRGRYKSGSKVDASDQYILAWLIQLITKSADINCFGYFDHIVVDEVQDLAPIQMALINELHNNSMTLVGDVTQKIFESGIDSWDQFDVTINNSFELTMCHRATLQTVLFANELLAQEGDKIFSTKVGKQGEKPLIQVASNRTSALGNAVKYVKDIKKREPKASVAVVSYRNYDLKWIHEEITKAGIDGYIASRKDWEFSPRVAVTTYHQIKGLEFDYVIILGLNAYEEKVEGGNKERVVYTVVTRAQKRVYIGCVKEVPGLIHKVDNSLFELC